VDPSGLTERQRGFLESLSADERGRFEARSVRGRADILAMVEKASTVEARDDVRRYLAPERPSRPPITDETSSETLMERLAAGDANAVPILAGRFVRGFKDQKSFRFYVARLNEVATGVRPVESIIEAYRQAIGPKARKPAAVFVHALEAWGHQHAPTLSGAI
jgi:hypothetical protein